MDYIKLIQLVSPIIAAIHDVISLLEKINMFPDNWYTAIDMSKAFYFTPVNKNHQKQFCFS